MDQLQYSIPFVKIEHVDRKGVANLSGSLIYIMHADKIPPHIGWSVDHLFYSLKANGIDYDFPRPKLDTLLFSKSIPTLVIALRDNHSIERTRQAFEQFGQSINKGNTCLSPIDQIIHGSSGNATRIGDLLQQLDNEKQIEKIYGIHIPDSYSGIAAYSAEDINARIKKLKQND